jgi:cysteine sulfinate desulfinase/cysteine desulfurase-like protein
VPFHERRAGGRDLAGQLRRVRRGPALAYRAQARRTVRRRGCDCCAATCTATGRRHTRSGTLDIRAILRLATTVKIAAADAPRRAALAALRDYLVARVLAVVPDARSTGTPALTRSTGSPSRLPGNAYVSIPGCEGDSLLMLLDAHGIECSTGSAYTIGLAQPRHVLLAVRTKRQRAGRCASPSAVPRPPSTSTRWPR